MSSPRVLSLAIAAVALVAVSGFLLYDTFLRGDAIDPLALPSASAASPDPSAAGTEPSVAAASPDPSATGPTDGTDVAGTWTVGAGSQAGYRVREQLANLPAESDAVGRTDAVTGSVTIETTGDGASLTDGSITVDTTTIASDEAMRDRRMRTEGLQTDTYPTATFTLTEPVAVPASALTGAATTLTLVGDLTLHGVTQRVTIPAEAQLDDGSIAVAGSLTFPLRDFGIVAPNVGGFIVSIADEGTLEFLLVLTRD